MATKNIGGSIDPLVPPALNLTFEGQKRLPTADSISLSFKTLLSLVEKLFGQYALSPLLEQEKLQKYVANFMQCCAVT